MKILKFRLILPLLLLSAASRLSAQDQYDGYAFKGQVATMTTFNGYNSDSLIFNRDGKVTEVWIKETDMDDSWEKIVKIDYDKFGNKSEYRTYVNGDEYEYFIYKYNEKNLVVERIAVMQADVNEEKVVYTYDAKDWLVKEELYTGDVLDREITYTYNEKGLLLEKNKGYLGTDWYIYDANGRIIEEKSEYMDVKGKMSAQTTTNTYNAYGRLVQSVTVNGKGKTVRTNTYTYDAKGYQTTDIVILKKKPLAYAYLYEFDASGNWTKYTTTVDGETYVVERKFTYY